jgi:hypothetical protein
VIADPEEYPAGWLTQFRRGILAGLASLIVGIAGASAVTLLAWLIPGADTASAIAAIKAAGLVVLSGHQGGIVLDGSLVTLAPLLVTLLLGWLAVSTARRADSGSAFAGWCVGYTIACALVAWWARLGATYAPLWRSAVAGLLFALIIGGAGRYFESGWAQLAPRWQRIIRAAVGVVAVYAMAAALLAAVSVARHLDALVALQQRVSPGAAGLSVALLGVAAAPNATVAAMGYLTGPGFAIGSHTSVSMFATSRGRLPIFPLLGGLPIGQPATTLGIVLGLTTAFAAGAVAHRTVRHTASESALTTLADNAAVAALVAGSLAVLAVLAGGGVGHGTLSGVGVTWWAIGAASLPLVFLAAAGCLAVDLARHRRQLSAEQREFSTIS